MQIQEKNSAKLGGITPDTMSTLGTVYLTIKSKPYKFHVVHNGFPILDDAIIGRPLMRAEEAVISDYTNCLMIAGDVMNPIPFLTPDERLYHLQRVPQLNEVYAKNYEAKPVMNLVNKESPVNYETSDSEESTIEWGTKVGQINPIQLTTEPFTLTGGALQKDKSYKDQRKIKICSWNVAGIRAALDKG